MPGITTCEAKGGQPGTSRTGTLPPKSLSESIPKLLTFSDSAEILRGGNDMETKLAAHDLGTEWTAPGEGSTWRELVNAFHPLRLIPYRFAIKPYDLRTNLKLTGNALTNKDRERWNSGRIK